MSLLACGFTGALATLPLASKAEELAQSTVTCERAAANPDLGIEACTRLIDSKPAPPNVRVAAALTMRGLAWIAKNDTRRALSDFSRAIVLAPDFVPSYEARAELFRANGNCKDAIPDYGRVVQLSPERTRAFISRAACRIRHADYDPALADLDVVINADTDNAAGLAAAAWKMKSRAFMGKGAADLTLNALDQVIKFEPNEPAAYLERATLLAGRRDSSRAFADLDNAVKLDPGNEKGFAAAALIMRKDYVEYRAAVEELKRLK